MIQDDIDPSSHSFNHELFEDHQLLSSHLQSVREIITPQSQFMSSSSFDAVLAEVNEIIDTNPKTTNGMYKNFCLKTVFV